MRRVYLPNEARAEAEATRIRETFTDKPAEWREEFSWGWPRKITEIGVGLAVMYRSDKWRRKGDYEDYKHICESSVPWKLYATPEFMDELAEVHPKKPVALSRMPDTIAMLALFLGIQCRLFAENERGGVYLPNGDEGIFEVKIRQAKLAAGKTTDGGVFLCVYKTDDGPLLFLFGEKLDVEKDGIVG